MKYHVPGVYAEKKNYTPMPQIDTRCLTGFVGIAERGNINEPVHIHSFAEYQEYFGGFETVGKLPASVCGFFQNGGKECIVVRIAHEEDAEKAFMSIPGSGKGDGEITLTALTPGEWGNRIRVSLWKENDANFSITLSCGSKVENFVHLSYDKDDERYFAKYIKDHSVLTDISVKGEIKQFNPILSRNYENGDDGLDSLSAGDFIGHYKTPTDYSGLGTFEHYDQVALIAAPDICNLKELFDKYVVQNAMVEQAEKFYNRFAVLDVPSDLNVSEACEWAELFDSSFAALYYPNVAYNMPLSAGGGSDSIPASGLICGVLAGLDKEKGIFYPPAGMALSGVSGVDEKFTMAEQEMLYDGKVNYFKQFVSSGVKIWGCRTLSSDEDWRSINVRRTFNRVCKYLKDETRWAVFEPNNTDLRKHLVRFVTSFLIGLWRKGYLMGRKMEDAFYVRCDSEINPPENVRRGIVTFEVGIAIVRPLEFFKISFSADQNGSNVYFEANE